MIRSAEFSQFINSINVNIGSNLLKTKNRPSIKFKIEISKKLKDFLQKKYDINGRFKKQNDFMRDADLLTNNFYNENDCHRIYADSFEIKLTVNEKKFAIMTRINGEIERRILSKNPFVTIKFLRQNKIFFNEEDRCFLNQFN